MVDDSAVTFRDRTNEFSSTVKLFTQRKSKGPLKPCNTSGGVTNPENNIQDIHSADKKELSFQNFAQLLRDDIENTTSKLEKLKLLTSKLTLFNDKPLEIQELTVIINQDLTSLTQQILRLQQSRNASIHSTPNKQEGEHQVNIIAFLKDQVSSLSVDFKKTLESRTEVLRRQQERRTQFSPPASSLSSKLRHRDQRFIYLDAPYSHEDSPSAIDMGLADAQLLASPKKSYLDSRASAVEEISKTLHQLTGVFQQLGEILNQQMPDLERIDHNLGYAEENVSLAHTELLRYFSSISSNRWLMIKIFSILIVFFLIFTLFFA
ncbi:syntaxin-5-like isoform X2 [Zophobas morio]|uniref:syntaxin-5-like isoform X2 n=1 Tax=Zophobas morio TaxID=2755281 RepID=UPI003083850C